MKQDSCSLQRRNSAPSAVLVPARQTILSNGSYYNHHNNNHRKSQSPPASISGADFELISFTSMEPNSYTSLRDLIPSTSTPTSHLSPPPPTTANSTGNSAGNSAGNFAGGSSSGYEISIRNRLVKQAAWAYLQPTAVSSAATSSARRLFFFSGESLRPFFSDLRRHVVETATRVYDWLVDALWLILCR